MAGVLAALELFGPEIYWLCGIGKVILCSQKPPLDPNVYLLTYSTVQSPSWEGNWFAASQEIPCILWNPKVHYRTHKRPQPVPILGQPNPDHIPTSHLLEILSNIIQPSTPRSPQWSLSLRFPHQDPVHPPLLTHTLCKRHKTKFCVEFCTKCEMKNNGLMGSELKPTEKGS